jgi:hypothetical protein
MLPLKLSCGFAIFRQLFHRIDYAEVRLLGFSYVWFSNDFGVTVIRHQNADAMGLASARLRGIPPENIQNGGRPGGNASHKRTG